ncbi:MAG: ABC transporter substrate-binding protein [Oscillospiraceae bacterium]|jgi:putative ABC transport system substrate-binding protein|nr:ABC transporter substrate-binding protein [Oscillospiraceae bacterium]
MKKSVKILCAVLALALVFSLAACSEPRPAASDSPEASGGASPSASDMKIGILQYATHASLYNCYTGILEGLKNEGFIDGETCAIEYIDGQGESETNGLAAANFVTKNYDIIIAIATPAAMTSYAAAKEAGIPVVFSACSDPVGAGLVESLEAPNTGATGTSDSLNFDAQLKMIRAFLPDAKKIGVLYTTSEANSVSQLEKLTGLAPDYGFEIVSVGVTDASEVAAGAASLISQGVDCINNLTDNNVVNNLSIVTSAADAAGLPIFGSEVEQVAKYGCVASESLDYVALGVTTGEMAGKILKGVDVKTLPVAVITDSEPVYSLTNMEKFALALPADYSAAENTDAQ